MPPDGKIPNLFVRLALIIQVPRRFASFASRTRLQDNFRVADQPLTMRRTRSEELGAVD
jgi:hypothetical protein